jgi:hypothetical protein
VAEDRAVLHQAVAQEHPLAGDDVLGGEQHATVGRDDFFWNRWLVLVGAIGQQPQDEEPEGEYQHGGLYPGFRDEQAAAWSIDAGRLGIL